MTHKERQARRLEAIKRVAAGEKPIALAHEYGLHVTTIYAWVRGENPMKDLPPRRPMTTVERAIKTNPVSVFQLGAN